MNATTRACLSLAIMAVAVLLAGLRVVGLFGSLTTADGGLFLIVTIGILAVVLYPHRKDHRGRQ